MAVVYHETCDVLDEVPPMLGNWRPCVVMGKCNSCDIKIKTDRFQRYGHSSVEIKNVSTPYATHNPMLNVVNTYGQA